MEDIVWHCSCKCRTAMTFTVTSSDYFHINYIWMKARVMDLIRYTLQWRLVWKLKDFYVEGWLAKHYYLRKAFVMAYKVNNIRITE